MSTHVLVATTLRISVWVGTVNTNFFVLVAIDSLASMTTSVDVMLIDDLTSISSLLSGSTYVPIAASFIFFAASSMPSLESDLTLSF